MTEPNITLIGPADHMQGPIFPTLLVLHDEEFNTGPGSAHAVAVMFTSPNAGGLAHYICDTGATEHCCQDHTACWHAPPNFFFFGGVRYGSIGFEQDGYAHYSPGDWGTPDAQGTILRTAREAARAATDYGIPPVFLSVDDITAAFNAGKPPQGVTTHNNMSLSQRQSTHTDPGPNYPVTQFMNWMRSFMGAPIPEGTTTEMITVTCSKTGDRTLVDPEGETFNFDKEGGLSPVRALPGLNTHPEWNAGQGHAEGPVVGAWNWPDGAAGTPAHDGIVFQTRDAAGAFHAYRFHGDGSV